ncbi:MAG: hypothetical protein KJP00_06110 [Bacteroidia bacterium]|nr:hypothetical protein [Bacteroidia bacterium]
MKEELFEKDIMDFVDGKAKDISNEEAALIGHDLKQIVYDLKSMPLEKVPTTTDKSINDFIKGIPQQKQSILRLNKWWPVMVAAASFALLILVFNQGNSLQDDYQILASNPDKLNFIYKLNEKELNGSDIAWLNSELKKENNPNIKVTIVDLLNNYQSKLDNDFIRQLEDESTPSVQMALLNTLEEIQYEDLNNDLWAFTERKNLDNMVKSKASSILSKSTN